MNPEPSQRQCAACEALEPSVSFILTVIKDNVYRGLCIDCLLKEHRNLFCPVCLNVYAAVPPPEATTICLRCSSTSHLHCSPPPPSTSSSNDRFFTCPPCLNPNFSFFPKSLATSSDQSGDNDDDGSVLLYLQKAKAILAAAEIAVAYAKNAAEKSQEEVVKKSLECRDAKKRAKEALVLVMNIEENASEEKINPKKRKASDL